MSRSRKPAAAVLYVGAPKPSPMRGRWHGEAVTDEVGQLHLRGAVHLISRLRRQLPLIGEAFGMHKTKASPPRGGGSAKPRRRGRCKFDTTSQSAFGCQHPYPFCPFGTFPPDRGNRPLQGEPRVCAIHAGMRAIRAGLVAWAGGGVVQCVRRNALCASQGGNEG